ncbi:MAG: hypothetical protein ABJF01_09525 [bacterium]
MRLVLRAMCAAALVGCSDVHAPVETNRVSLEPGPIGRSPDPTDHTGIDPRPLTDRIEELVVRSLGRVSLPADAYSLSSEAVHPDMACAPSTWSGARCWLMYTPYKNSESSYENPAFLLADSDTSWTTPPGVRNPIIPYPGASGYNSDPDHAFDPTTRRIVQVYRVVENDFNKIMMMSTGDAHTWTPPVVAFKERNHDAISPSLIIEEDRTAKIWYVRAGTDGCNATSSSVQLRVASPDSDSRYEHANWSTPTNVTMSIPGFVVWHLDIIELPDGGYLALIAAFARGMNCASSDVWLASSSDGVSWRTYAAPIFWRGMNAAKQRSISTWYRGTLRYDARTDSLDVWPSAMSKGTWGVYHASLKLSEVLGLLRSSVAADYRPSTNLSSVRLTMPMP